MTHPSVTKSFFSSAVVLGLGGLGVLASACSSASTPGTSSSAINVCDAPVTVPMAVQASCSLPSATYTAGVAQKGTSGALTFQIVSVNGDAIAQGLDSWTIKVTDANCQPVDDLALTIKLWMPQHNHGWLASTSTGEGGGVYDIGNMDFFMDGFWQVTITASGAATSDAGTADPVTDSTVFSFCLSD
jgi:hypothetical protein